jgi:hypothetical protein
MPVVDQIPYLPGGWGKLDKYGMKYARKSINEDHFIPFFGHFIPKYGMNFSHVFS